MLEAVKRFIGVRSSIHDEEIQSLIASAEMELKGGDVKPAAFSSDPRIPMAIKLYCKAFFGRHEGPNEGYYAAFARLRDAIALYRDDIEG